MGMANWVVGKMVDAFLAQPPEEKAAVFDTMATKFWDAATPEEIAKISELLLPRFLEHFLGTATTEQKVEMMRSMLDSDQLQGMTQEMLPGLVEAFLKNMSPEQWQQLIPGMPGMSGMPGMPKTPERPRKSGVVWEKDESPSTDTKREPPEKPGGMGGMMPW